MRLDNEVLLEIEIEDDFELLKVLNSLLLLLVWLLLELEFNTGFFFDGVKFCEDFLG